MRKLLFAFAILLVFSAISVRADEPQPVKIWGGQARHNAFTDIIQFNGQFYCSFREGIGHIPGKKTGQGDGKARILVSNDGTNWKPVALLQKKTYDLRDPKLSVTPDGRIMVLMGGSLYVDGVLKSRRPFVSFSDQKGLNFSDPIPIRIAPAAATHMDWLWRVTWHKGVGYGVVYQPSTVQGKDWKVYLVRTTNGIDYALLTRLNVKGHPNESTVRFVPDSDTMKILVRREAQGRQAMLGTSEEPYTDWRWVDTGQSLGGPNFIFLPNGTLLAGGRVEGQTGLGTIDSEGTFKLFRILPSTGDNSYPGFCISDKTLYITYYSTEKENVVSIFLVKYPLDELIKSL